MAKKKIVIGLVGEAGSGKDTASGYIAKKFGAAVFRYSDVLTEALRIFLDEIRREDQIWLSIELRKRFGNDVLSRALAKRIKNAAEDVIVINGIRIEDDLKFVSLLPGASTIYITLEQKERWRRNLKRGEKADDEMSFEKFRELDKKETEINIPKLGKNADYRIENSGTKEELFEKIDEIIGKLS